MAGKGFVFLESYYEAAKDLPDKQRLALYDAIIKYALKSEEAKLAGITKSLFVLIQPVIDKSAKRAKAGRKGGVSKNNICSADDDKKTVSKTQAKSEKSVSKTEANKKQNASDYIMALYPTDKEDLSPTEIVDKDPATQEDNDFASQKEKDYDPPPKSPQGDLQGELSKSSLSDNVKSALSEWLDYKRERKEKYTLTGWKKLLTITAQQIENHPESDVIALIEESMANGWQGIIWDKLGRKSTQNPPESRWDYL